MTVGFIGLGIMGQGMAGNLLQHDVPLIVHNRTADKAQPLLAAGAQWAESPKGVASVDILFTMLAHPEAVRSVALGADGFLDHLQPGALWVDCSTVHPRFAREMDAEAASRDIHYSDAPVVGTKPQAEGAQLVFFVGADEADLARCRPYLDMMGRLVVHVGPPGMGTSIKVVINALLAQAMASLAESMALGQALGLSEDMLFNTLIGGPVTAPFLASKRDMIAAGQYDAQFPLQWMHKDLLMVAEAARDVELEMPLASTAETVYRAAKEEGLGNLDFSAVYKHYNPDPAVGE